MEDDEAKIIELNKEIQALKDEHDRLVEEHEALDDEHDRIEKVLAGIDKEIAFTRQMHAKKIKERLEYLKAITLVQAEMQKLRDYVSEECERLAQ